MKPEVFLKNIDLVSEASNGIESLRKYVLSLAVQGKLVPQDLKEKSAIDLYKQKTGRSPKTITKNDSFKLPNSWLWLSLEQVCEYIQRGKSPEYVEKSEYLVVSQKCVQWSGFNISRARYISSSSVKKYGPERFIRVGDLLWNSTGLGTLGRINAIEKTLPHEKVVADSHVTILRPLEIIISKYIYCWVASPYVQGVIDEMSTGSTKQTELATSTIRELLIPLPPVEEQKRIVAKVDQLMALCDELEAKQEKQTRTRRQLNDASLNALLSAASPDEFEKHWQRIVDNFDLLYDDLDNLKFLRQGIMQLAVSGKLVSQDIADENAWAALEHANKKEKNSIRMKIKGLEESGVKTLVPLFEVPNGWTWAEFWDLPMIKVGVGLDRGKSMQGPDGKYAYFKMNNIKNSGGIDQFDLTRIDANEDEVEAFSLNDGDFLFNTRNSRELVGKTCVFRFLKGETVLYNNNILRVTFCDGFSADYLDFWFRSPIGKRELEKLKSNTTNVCAIYQGKLMNFPCPIPPFTEQKRIVAKVDQLMALCDELEKKLTAKSSHLEKLTESLLNS